jgi:hypothetical protein
MIISGKILTADVPTSTTGSVYPREEIDKMVSNFMLSSTSIFSEFNPIPADGHDLGRLQLDRLCGRVRHLELHDDELFGEIEILDTPVGNEVKSLKLEGAEFGLCFAGTGVIENDKSISSLHLLRIDLELLNKEKA